MSEEFIAKFVNSGIMTKGGNATPLNVPIDEIKEISRAMQLTNLIRYGSAIKSIQKGIVSPTGASQTVLPNRTITISTIDPTKSLVLFDNMISGASASGGVTVFGATIVSLTSTQLVVTPSYQRFDGQMYAYQGYPLSWQLIEFY